MSERIELQCKRIEDCGLFLRGAARGSAPASFPLVEVMAHLHAWRQGITDFRETKRGEGDHGGNGGTTYLLGSAESDGDYMLSLFVESETAEGGVVKLTPDERGVGFRVEMEQVGNDQIAGFPVYLWVMPAERLVAAVRFPKRSNGLQPLQRFMRSFIRYNATISVWEDATDNTERTLIGYDLGEDELATLYPRFELKQAQEDPQIERLIQKIDQITHVERKASLRSIPAPTSKVENVRKWVGFSRRPRLGEDEEERFSLTVRMRYTPTAEEIRAAHRELLEDDEEDENVGFFVKDLGRTVWLRGAKLVESQRVELPRRRGNVHLPADLLSRVARFKQGLIDRLAQPQEPEEEA